MKDNKFDFIVCYSNQQSLNKCISSLNSLKMPEGYEMDILGVENAEDIEAAYQAMMEESDAKYKVYIRENTYIVNNNFLFDVLNSFEQNSQIGMIGVLGEKKEDCDYGKWNVGRVAVCNDVRETNVLETNEVDGTYVDTLCGMVLVTNCDLPWKNDDQTQGMYFDLKHSSEMRRSGYQLFVPYQESFWCIYESGSSLYDRNDVFTEDYGCRYFLSEKVNESNPLVSVIVPVYNGEEFVHETIESILNQTYSNLQIIVIDDCSTDGSRNVINQFDDSRIEKVFLQNNCNICMASNIAYERARGKYVALIGHDDIWQSRKLSEQISFMELYPEIGVSFTICDIIDKNGEVCSKTIGQAFYNLFNQENRTREEWATKLFFTNNCLCAPSSVIRKSLLKKELYHVGLIQLQDYALWLDIIQESNLYILHQRLIRYRRFFGEDRNLSASTRKKNNRVIHETIYVKNSFLKDIDDETFLFLFKKYLIDQSATLHEEIQCEKAFMLKNMGMCTSIEAFLDLFHNERTRQILTEQYHFSQADFYLYNQGGFSFDSDYVYEINELTRMVLQYEKIVDKLTKE